MGGTYLGSLVRVHFSMCLGSVWKVSVAKYITEIKRNVRLDAGLDLLFGFKDLGQIVDETRECCSVKSGDNVGCYKRMVSLDNKQEERKHTKGTNGLDDLGSFPLVGSGDAAHGKLANVEDDLSDYGELLAFFINVTKSKHTDHDPGSPVAIVGIRANDE